MKNPINWKDHVVEHPDYYREVNIDPSSGLVQHVKAPGEVLQQGTPMSAKNFNNMDLGAIQGILVGLFASQYMKHYADVLDDVDKERAQANQIALFTAAIANQTLQKVEGLEGEVIEVTLSNTQKYPFNNSKKSVQLLKNRSTKDYLVQVDVLEKTGGGIGDIEISDKLLNGFKIAYTGAATSVKVNCIIRGGV